PVGEREPRVKIPYVSFLHSLWNFLPPSESPVMDSIPKTFMPDGSPPCASRKCVVRNICICLCCSPCD
ncbi:unnamed protein product, partial [Staurois parvus]